MFDELISVIVPIYNVEGYLRRCIESILNQTYTNLEILLIDDGSTDDCASICDEYAKIDKRIKVFHQENSGLSGARNTGIKNFSGDYVTFIDSDDYVHPLFVEYLYRALNEGDYKIAMSLFKYCVNECPHPSCSDINYKLLFISQENSYKGLFNKKFRNTYPISNVPFITSWGHLYAREIIRDNYYKYIISEDIEFNSRILLKISQIALVPVVLYYWVRRPNSLALNPSSSIYNDYYGILKPFELSLNNIPKDQGLYRGLAVEALFKAILSVKYDNFNNKKDSKDYLKTKNLIQKTYNKIRIELIDNKYISLKSKFILFFLYKIPISYCLFRKLMEFFTRISRIYKEK